MCTTFVFSSFRSSSFWYCHDKSSLLLDSYDASHNSEPNHYHRIIVVIFEALDRLLFLIHLEMGHYPNHPRQ
ncbi:hypothetical protein DOS70_03745 [Staphylococcus felis]|uniref:Uncharacterized protein n=1 Tax=Staphylococcus felis TaxID=46127 RepID=A0A2K3ZFX6_9STAP|nr:hypothetical protein C7J90_07460 [Staphylococcus felis]PNZ36388.1 hypothetical protein CD143_04255 [Staphylococcus felis]REH77396.1 hypothetical protein DOS59_07075 [Staphylococcus felis]REH79953.1 hypothetical protein DOS60_01150 [Staphylococcus felis]REH80156.1 hypothetical protein DOS57_01855 [Staphylococcus felis]